MRLLMLLWFFFMGVYYCQGQKGEEQFNTLKQQLLQANSSNTKINALFNLGEAYWFKRKLPEALINLQEVILLSKQTGNNIHLCNAQLLIGHVYLKLNQFDSAMFFLKGCLLCAQQNKQDEHIPKVYESLSMMYYTLGDNEKGINYGLQAANLFEKNKLPKIRIQRVYAWFSIGRIFSHMGDFKKANHYFNRALSVGRLEKDLNIIIVSLISLGGNCYATKNYQEAKKYYQQVHSMLQNSYLTDLTVESIKGLGSVALVEKQFSKSIAYFRKGVELSQKSNLLVLLDNLYYQLGDAYSQAEQYDSANTYFQKALTLANTDERLSLKSNIYGQLAKLEIIKGNKEKGIYFLQLEKVYSDSMEMIEKFKTISKLEMLYQNEKKEKEIIALQADNSVKKVAIENQYKIIGIFSILSICLFVIAALLYVNGKQKKLLALKQQVLKDEEVKFLQRQQQLLNLQSMLNGQETERTRIAKDLHDGLGGLFSTVKMYFSTLQHEQPALLQNALFRKSYEMVDSSATELRRIAHNMMPEVLLKLGLKLALQDLCNSISAGRKVQVSVQLKGLEKRLDASAEITLYRIIQELLNNITKHAEATEVVVQFINDGHRLSVTVEDNGKGFDTSILLKGNHAGLESVKSRVTYLNGTINIESMENEGTTVMMDFIFP